MEGRRQLRDGLPHPQLGLIAMSRITRRAAIAAAGALALPRFAIAQAAGPDRRPSITIAVQKISNSNTLEVLREISNVGLRTFSMIAETLIEMDWTGSLKLVPGLAESWTRIDPQTLEVTLREGVRMHNGDLLSAEDVLFTFGKERMWSGAAPGSAGAYTQLTAGAASKVPPQEVPLVARNHLPGFDRVEQTGPRTLRFVNRTPDLALEGRLSRFSASILARRPWAEAANWLEFARACVASGPYRVVRYRPDQDLTLEAHDAYWGGRPPLRAIRMVEVPEATARVNGLLAGDYDFACDLSPDQIVTVEGSARHNVVGGPIANIRMTSFDTTHAVLANPLVRRAMTHAVDRQAIVDALWAGRTRVPRGLQFDYYGAMLVADWKVPEFNPALARDLVKQAGYKGEEIPYQLLNNYYTAQVPTAQVMVEGWRAVGLNVVIEMAENWAQVLGKTPRRGICDGSIGSAFPDPVVSLSGFAPGAQNWNAGQYRNEDYAAAYKVLETGTDPAQRLAAHRRLLEIGEREAPGWNVIHQNATFTGKRRDMAWKQGFSFAMDFRATNWG